MLFPHPSSRQQLQWCLVEDTACPHHRRYHPSKSSLHLRGGSAVTRPHHCQLQWPSSVSRPHHCSRSDSRATSLWGGHQVYHNLAPRLCKQSDLGKQPSTLSTLYFTDNLYIAIQSESLSGYFCRHLQQSSIHRVRLRWVWRPRHSITNLSSFHCMQHTPVRIQIASISTFCNPSHSFDLQEHSPPGGPHLCLGIEI